jgi:uncharacterized membrane protein
MKIVVEFVFFEVSLSNFIRKVEKSFKSNEEETVISYHVILLKDFVNHVLQAQSIVYSSEREAIKTYLIKVFHYLLSLFMTMLVVQAICMYEEFRISIFFFVYLRFS